MEALVLLVIGVIATPILLVIAHLSKSNNNQKTDESTIRRRVPPQLYCPRCGSPVIQYEDGWECGWCGDSCRY